MQWTRDQQTAIEARGGTLLVSAAAGSGKTAVLVERVLQRLEDPVNGCAADELLIVTFTKAATTQMRDKIASALQKRIQEDPLNEHLLRQQALLPFAHISTIDSFCAEIVRENFQDLGIEPDYQVLDDHSLHVMQEETASELVEQLYSEDDGTFSELCELLFRGRDDRKLIDTILELNKVASSYDDPDQWLAGLYSGYDPAVPLGETIWGTLAAQTARRVVHLCIDNVDQALRLIRRDADVDKKYTPFLSEERAALERLLDVFSGTDWDAMREAALGALKTLPPRAPSVTGNHSYEKNAAHHVHEKVKERITKQIVPLFCSTAAEYAEDAAYCAPIIRTLSEAVIRYRAMLLERKHAANGYEFSDVSLFALRCLQDENGAKTAYARALSETFCEILVDEFQDVNGAQYKLFTLLSREGSNLFMVGDAKQSIYKFRQARPDIFISLKEKYPLYADENYPALVLLDCNFRSRSGVTQWVNFVFHQIMHSEEDRIFDINYDEREFLRPAAQYPPSPIPDAQLHVLECKRGTEDRLAAEARYVAQWILQQLDDGLTVTENGVQRPATFGDFCVLLRADSGRISKIANVFVQYGIPVQAPPQGSLFDAPEVRFLVSLLQVLDNPTQDVPLLAVLLSPVFGFTPDDMTALRVGDRESSLYALVNAASAADERYAAFLSRLLDLRMLASTLSVPELVRRLLDETGYEAIAAAMSGGVGRQANLRLVQQLAAQYTQTGRFGLSGFVRYLERLEERGKTEKASTGVRSAVLLQIMTMHGSKGLEFPVCILMNCGGSYNEEDLKNNYVYHNVYGMATVRRDTAQFIQYDTVPKRVLTAKVRESSRNEELRVLYVAMTRAKEKLIAVTTLENAEKRLMSLSVRANADGSVGGVLEMGNYGDLLLAASLRHPDAHALREAAGIPASSVMLPADFPLHVVLAQPPAELPPERECVQTREADDALLAQIEARVQYVYPYAALSAATAKHVASGMQQEGIDSEFFASARPAFLASGGLTPAQRGTALHKFMQLADYAAASQDVHTELQRLFDTGALTAQERDVVPVDAVRAFFRSTIGQRLLHAQTMLREQRFTIELPLEAVYPLLASVADGETVVVQGMVDCAFVEDGKLYIVDYKTDREPPQVLRERYRTQMRTYRDAMAQCTDYPVAGVCLYSFHNHCQIDMDFS
ncbi:MAG: helicase-exonuclease AddAB subunit AddA [Clostridia bacterium]|nr:helicase-exonuclease AddAB subunit AddA [Clostridia bacterium]